MECAITNFVSQLWGPVVDIWEWTKAHDISNLLATAFTAVLWPLALIFWHRRKIRSVPGLEVHFSVGEISIFGGKHAAVAIEFTNHTGSVVYVSGARIRGCTELFPVPQEAARDIAKDSYHLKFGKEGAASGQVNFVLREMTIQTNDSAHTCMPTTNGLGADFYKHSPPKWRRLLRKQKYFVIEYTVMVGTARHVVATVY